jgi:hypothetical protein
MVQRRCQCEVGTVRSVVSDHDAAARGGFHLRVVGASLPIDAAPHWWPSEVRALTAPAMAEAGSRSQSLDPRVVEFTPASLAGAFSNQGRDRKSWRHEIAGLRQRSPLKLRPRAPSLRRALQPHDRAGLHCLSASDTLDCMQAGGGPSSGSSGELVAGSGARQPECGEGFRPAT